MSRSRKNVIRLSRETQKYHSRTWWQGTPCIYYICSQQVAVSCRYYTINSVFYIFQLQVYVKDSPSHNILTSKKEVPPRPSNQNQQASPNNTDTEKRVIAVMTMPNRVNESLPSSMSLKLNGVASSVVPVNVENLSSLMQVVPNTEMPRIQKFNIPLQVRKHILSEFSTVLLWLM